MGHEIDFSVDLIVTRAAIENQLYVRDAVFRDDLSITFEVKADITPENARKLTGELYLYGGDGPSPEDLGERNASWIFYTPDRFRADLHIPSPHLERIWNVFSRSPQWFCFSIDGPGVVELGRPYPGEIRLSYRAGYEVSQSQKL
jgi:hypothetical protein